MDITVVYIVPQEKKREKEELSITCDTTSSKSKVSQLFILYSVALSGNKKVKKRQKGAKKRKKKPHQKKK